MSNVTLEIAGRPFAVSCADGEEAHIEMLGRMIDDRARRIGSGQSEPRMLLFAALMLADELHEAHRQTPAAPPQAAAPIAAPAQDDAAAVERIVQLAERIENLAATLEQAVHSA
ncbi:MULTISPECIES: cell division protein ZapA [Novosphingobium]|uniref:cell division protein ZapA n=1 Tax=Novosphingobium TaxID=165696 RepID=UPI000D6DD71A|nr:MULTISPECIES: cell division protein ZapA [Novosphingobium]